MNSLLQKQMLEKFNCEKCRFSTKDPNKYKNHVSLHNDIKYACSHCDFVSYTKTEFQRHLVTHTGKFPYTCGYCGYGAIRNDYIVKHIKRIHGDGKIQCSVSTVENESKKASINITQTQVPVPNIQDILQNGPSSLTADVIDLTADVDNLGSGNNTLFPNGNNISGHVEVEVISPVDQPLHPWIPLTVVAPTSFKVPPNCIAQVIEVKPVNSACHLVLKYINVIESNLPNQPPKIEPIFEPKSLEPHVPLKTIVENPDGASLQECAVLNVHGQESPLPPSNTLCGTAENLHTPVTCPSENTNEIINAINDVANDMFEDLEEFTGGPIISSVFSLSVDSHNAIEGIQWECPFSSPKTSPSKDEAEVTHCSLIPPTCQEEPTLPGSELISQMDIDKTQDVLKNTVLEGEKAPSAVLESEKAPSAVLESEKAPSAVLESEKEPSAVLESEKEPSAVLESEKEPCETKIENSTQCTDPPIQLSIKSALTDVKKPDSQPCAPQKSRKGGRISNRLGKIETNNFSKPQTLFLSYDKRIVMQPLSCTMQSSSQKCLVDKQSLPLAVKTRKESVREKLKRLVAPTVKCKPQPILRTLRLHPFKKDQMTCMPTYDQPVVVLNHPDVESIEVSHIMKAIRVFRGKITKITLSKQMSKKCV
ncbi:zinc finger protein 518B [Engystomops pustulosus]|uniref:zinc finger protein 518B n=1 Tax=Engystomops pustulosus TaxID=76066 RepID=UPI003AFB5A8A